MRWFYWHSLASGNAFDWFPDVWSGMYLQGDGTVGMYHPLHRLLYGLLPLDVAFNLELLLSYPFMFAGTWWLLRRQALGPAAAALGGLLFTFSGFNLLHHLHINAVAVICHIPWQLLAIDVVLRDDRPRRRAWAQAGIGLLTASQVLLGYPHYLFFSSLAEGLYVALRVRRERLGRSLLALGAAKGLGLLAGAVQLLPTWDAVATSVRAEPTLEFRTSGSLHPLNLGQIVAPYLLADVVLGNRHEYGLYNGSLVSLLLVWLAMRRRRLGAHRRLALGCVALGIVALVLAMGRHAGVYGLVARLPLVDLFRVPARFLLLVHLAMAVAAAVAFADLLRACRSPAEGPRRWPLAVLPLASWGLAGLALWSRAGGGPLSRLLPELEPELARPWLILAGPVLLTATALLVAAAARGGRWALPALVLLGAADQAAYGLLYVWDTPSQTLAGFVASRPVPPAPRGRRVQSRDNTLIFHGLDLSLGALALNPGRVLPEDSPGAMRAAGVGWILADGEWLEVEDPAPRVMLVARAVATRDPAALIDQIDLGTTALVERPLDLDGGAAGEARVTLDRPGRIRIRARAPARRLLVLSESYDRGWRVEVGGEPGAVLRVNGDFMGCVLPAGEHEVTFRFAPRSLRRGRIASLVGLAGIVAWLLAGLARAPPATPL